MTDVDRYITDEAVEAAVDAWNLYPDLTNDKAGIRAEIRAAVPYIYPMIRADVLREIADQFTDDDTIEVHTTLLGWADEAVAE